MIKGLLKVEDRCPGIMMIIFSINDSIPIINLFYLAVYQDKAKKMRALQRDKYCLELEPNQKKLTKWWCTFLRQHWE